MVKNKYWMLPIAGLAMVILAFGCSEKIVPSSRVNMQVQAKIAVPEAVDQFRLTITAEDIETIIVPMEFLNGNQLVAETEVPSGPARVFTVEGLDELSRVLYRGETTTDVNYQEAVTLDIDLVPVVPMLRISPRTQEHLMTTEFQVSIDAFNIPNLYNITMDVLFASQNDLIWLDSIVMSPDPDSSRRLSWEGTYDATYIWLSESDVDSRLVDAAGKGRLATLYFNSHADTQAPADTTHLEILLQSAYEYQATALDSITYDIYTDDAFIYLTEPVTITE